MRLIPILTLLLSLPPCVCIGAEGTTSRARAAGAATRTVEQSRQDAARHADTNEADVPSEEGMTTEEATPTSDAKESKTESKTPSSGKTESEAKKATTAETEPEAKKATTAKTEPEAKKATTVKTAPEPKKATGTKASSKSGSKKKSKSEVKSPAERSITFLAMEQASRRSFPNLVKGLQTSQVFSRRLPANWSKVGVTDGQKEEIYAIEQEYFPEIAQLEARVARLKAERDAAMLEVLDNGQRKALEQVLQQAEAERGQKKLHPIDLAD